MSLLLFNTLEGTNSRDDVGNLEHALAECESSVCKLLCTQNHLLNVKCCINVINVYIAPSVVFIKCDHVSFLSNANR